MLCDNAMQLYGEKQTLHVRYLAAILFNELDKTNHDRESEYKIISLSMAFKPRENEITGPTDLQFVCLSHGNSSDLKTKTALMSTKALVDNMVCAFFNIYMYL